MCLLSSFLFSLSLFFFFLSQKYDNVIDIKNTLPGLSESGGSQDKQDNNQLVLPHAEIRILLRVQTPISSSRPSLSC